MSNGVNKIIVPIIIAIIITAGIGAFGVFGEPSNQTSNRVQNRFGFFQIHTANEEMAKPSVQTMAKIAKALGVAIEKLLK